MLQYIMYYLKEISDTKWYIDYIAFEEDGRK
jgi:hypothetical protein